MKSDSTHLSSLKKLFPDEQTRSFLTEMIDSLPNFIAILNEERQLIYSNQKMADVISIPAIEKAFNLRLGELFKCVNSEKEPDGCGFSEACELCGVFRAMEDSRISGIPVNNDLRLLSKDEGINKSYNFKFTSKPFKNNGVFYYIVSIEDISGEKRKAELERIFFHDIMNSIGSIHGVLSLMKRKVESDPLHIQILEAVYTSLFDMVNEQKQYTLAERGELQVNNEKLHTRNMLFKAKLHFSENINYSSNVELAENTIDANFYSDEALLSRILINMVKNALEASRNEAVIIIGAHLHDNNIRFWVKNPDIIPRQTQLLIFERAFSTKGSGRGLGTFSMKLLGENYLGGKVDFTSNEEEGTTFWIDLPYSSPLI